MIEERALVMTVEGKADNLAKVRAERKSACDGCSLKAGCGQSALAKLSSGKCIELTVENVLHAKPGDIVLLSIPEQGLLTASLLVYLMPLVLMLAFSMLAKSYLGWQDGAVALTGVLALMLGFGLARRYIVSHSDDSRFIPEMVGIALRRDEST